jgi:hypothetical protein
VNIPMIIPHAFLRSARDYRRRIGAPYVRLFGNPVKLCRVIDMATFIFRCPSTDQNVQGYLSSEELSEHGDGYFAVRCTACRRAHLVNPLTGTVLGSTGDDDEVDDD